MAVRTVRTDFNGDNCYRAVTVDDANELLDIGLGQYIPDHVPGTEYYIPAPCGTKCNDNNGKEWTNCEGYPSKASNAVNFPDVPKWILPVIGVLIVFIAFIYYKKTK